MTTTLNDVQTVRAFEVAHMARRGRTYQWRDEEIEEVKPVRVRASRARRPAPPLKPARLGFQNGLLLFTFCSVTLVFAVPALIAFLVLIYSVVIG